MNIVICDDEIEYANGIKNHVGLFMQDHNIDTHIDVFTSGEQMFERVDVSYDIAFLDIEIGNIKGTDIAAKLKEKNKHIIIFVITAYDKYLDDAMDLNVLRFILKPLDVKRLHSGLEKAISLIDNSILSFYLKKDNSLIKVNVNDIVYIEIVNRTTKVVTLNGEYVSNEKINFWHQNLTASFFYKVHSSFIINMKYITKYEKDIVELNGVYNVPVSYRTRSGFRTYFMNYFSGR